MENGNPAGFSRPAAVHLRDVSLRNRHIPSMRDGLRQPVSQNAGQRTLMHCARGSARRVAISTLNGDSFALLSSTTLAHAKQRDYLTTKFCAICIVHAHCSPL